MSSSVQMAPAELRDKLQGPNPPHLLDVRQPDEYELARLPDAKLIPLGELIDRVDELETWKKQEIVVYCHHGIRSLNAISQLRHLGFENLRNLNGGIDLYAIEIDPSVGRY